MPRYGWNSPTGDRRRRRTDDAKRFPRDPQDLRGVFGEHEGPAVDVAAQVDLGRPFPLTFPIQLGYVPEGFDVAGATEGRFLQVFDVNGFLIDIVVGEDFADRINEEQMRQIAQSLMVIPGAATDSSVWTDQPLL